MNDEELINEVCQGRISIHALEKLLSFDFERAVRVRRLVVERSVQAQRGKPRWPLDCAQHSSSLFPTENGLAPNDNNTDVCNGSNSTEQKSIDVPAIDNMHISPFSLSGVPLKDYKYEQVYGACCENVIGYLTIPMGVVGPLMMDGKPCWVPMATTEGALIASTQRGCKAIFQSFHDADKACPNSACAGRIGSVSCEGVTTVLYDDGMTRGPVVSFPSILKVYDFIRWLDHASNFQILRSIFNETSRYARLTSVTARPSGCDVFLRFKATTGDAMGMNMVSKGTQKCLEYLKENFKEMKIISISGNFCTDKKAAMVNWLEGRGKSAIAEAVLPLSVVQDVLKVDSLEALVETNMKKNFKGSAMAGTIGAGGFNAQAANIVTGIFLATGQDPAQNIVSSNCLTELEIIYRSCCSGSFIETSDVAKAVDFISCDGADPTTRVDKGHSRGKPFLRITCTMPSLEVGTIGGGTQLDCQKTCLSMLGIEGPHLKEPGNNSRHLARVVAATVLAGELSLLAALTEGSLVKSHLSLNRSSQNLLMSPEPQ